jgi:hypothetical protein
VLPSLHAAAYPHTTTKLSMVKMIKGVDWQDRHGIGKLRCGIQPRAGPLVLQHISTVSTSTHLERATVFGLQLLDVVVGSLIDQLWQVADKREPKRACGMKMKLQQRRGFTGRAHTAELHQDMTCMCHNICLTPVKADPYDIRMYMHLCLHISNQSCRHSTMRSHLVCTGNKLSEQVSCCLAGQ